MTFCIYGARRNHNEKMGSIGRTSPADRDGVCEAVRRGDWHCFKREERAIDLTEERGCSAAAIWKARARLRNRLRKLLIASGMDHDVVAQLLNQLERLRSRR